MRGRHGAPSAAILIADVAGYSRLSQIDEEGTRRCFQADMDDMILPKITEHHGRLVKTMETACWSNFTALSMPCIAQ